MEGQEGEYHSPLSLDHPVKPYDDEITIEVIEKRRRISIYRQPRNIDNGIVIKVNFRWFPWEKQPQN